MYILGLTGPIASGKSTVAEILKREGALILNADKVVHDMYKKGTPQNIRIQDIVLNSIEAENGDIDRQKLAELIKRKPHLLEEIEAYIHPEVRKAYKKELEAASSNRIEIAVIEAPIMFEGGLNTLCDSVAVCSCDLRHREERAMQRGGMTTEKFEFIVNKQISMSEYDEAADHIINTGISVLETEHEVLELIQKIRGEFPKAWPTMWVEI